MQSEEDQYNPRILMQIEQYACHCPDSGEKPRDDCGKFVEHTQMQRRNVPTATGEQQGTQHRHRQRRQQLGWPPRQRCHHHGEVDGRNHHPCPHLTEIGHNQGKTTRRLTRFPLRGRLPRLSGPRVNRGVDGKTRQQLSRLQGRPSCGAGDS